MSDAPDTRPRRYANGMARREAVLNAALELFVSRSVGGTTTRQIAVAAGLSQTGLRRHFRDKDEILLVLIERFLQAGEDQAGRSRSMPSSTGQSLDEPWSPEELVSMARHNLQSPSYVALFTTLLGTATSAEHSAHRRLRARYAHLRQSLGGAVAAHPPIPTMMVDPVAQAARLIAGWDGLLIQFAYDPTIDVPGHLQAHFDGLSGRPARHIAAAGPRRRRDELIAEVADDDLGYARGRQRRMTIIDEATRAFSRDGFHGATFAEIADATGIAKSMLLHYFPTKEVLLEAVLTHHDATTLPERIRPGLSARGELLQLADTAELNTGQPGLMQTYAVLCGEGAAPQHPAHGYFSRRTRRLRSYLIGVFERLQTEDGLKADRDPVHEAMWLQALWDGLQLQWLYDRKAIDLGGHLREHVESVFR
jgi:AcrR family transcriptional regulator